MSMTYKPSEIANRQDINCVVQSSTQVLLTVEKFIEVLQKIENQQQAVIFSMPKFITLNGKFKSCQDKSIMQFLI